jgi:trk system potassium uptake protein TrkA
VATVRWTADQILRRLQPHGAEPEWRDPTGAVVLAEVQLGEKWLGRSVVELQAATTARVAFLTRLGEALLPHAKTVLQDGDLVHVVMRDGDIDKVADIFASGPPEGE